jgi:peptidoglycan/xylan/chitin deacetylase (PgdA/CDA1 family)
VKRLLMAAVMAMALLVLVEPSAQAAGCSGYVALTYDDGPYPGHTENLLAELKRNKMRATFFNTGYNETQSPELTRRILKEGHEIGNHSFSHPEFWTMGYASVWGEVHLTDKVHKEITGQKSKLFRPPYGDMTHVWSIIPANGQQVALWTVDTNDWQPGVTAQTIVDRLKDVKAGDTVLMHDGYPETVKAVPGIKKLLDSKKLCAGRMVPGDTKQTAWPGDFNSKPAKW